MLMHHVDLLLLFGDLLQLVGLLSLVDLLLVDLLPLIYSFAEIFYGSMESFL
jgi:hypothetical protein